MYIVYCMNTAVRMTCRLFFPILRIIIHKQPVYYTAAAAAAAHTHTHCHHHQL